jgi:hypothetical protein
MWPIIASFRSGSYSSTEDPAFGDSLMKSFGGTPQGARLERMKASPSWAGERFRNVHPILEGLRDAAVPMPTLHELCGGKRRVPQRPHTAPRAMNY